MYKINILLKGILNFVKWVLLGLCIVDFSKI